MDENALSREIIAAAIEVHRSLGGPGLLESVYEEALAMELELRGFRVERQTAVPLYYKGRKMGNPLRLDLMVEGKVIVECKAVTNVKASETFENQALTYLRATRLRLALVINFGQSLLKSNIRRVVNGLTP